MDQDLRDWLEVRFGSLVAQIDALGVRVLDITGVLSKDIEHLREDINALFDRVRETESAIKVLDDVRMSSKSNVGTIISIVGTLIALTAVMVAIIL